MDRKEQQMCGLEDNQEKDRGSDGEMRNSKKGIVGNIDW